MIHIYRERIPWLDSRLKRHVLHDSRSKLYAFDTSGLSIASVRHERTLPVLDQADAGSCTAECAFGLLGTAPYASDQVTADIVARWGSFDQRGAYRFYSDEENLDGDGPFPPNDNGSTGLTMAKVARSSGAISGWTQVFNIGDFLKALTQFPIGCGTYWYNSMMNTDSSGRLTVSSSSGVAGGHEYECIGYDQSTDLLEFVNSWGTGWGADGHFFMKSNDFGSLLARQGDATIFTPGSQPAPQPTPVPSDPFSVAAAVLDPWAAKHHLNIGHPTNAQAAAAWRTYSKAVHNG